MTDVPANPEVKDAPKPGQEKSPTTDQNQKGPLDSLRGAYDVYKTTTDAAQQHGYGALKERLDALLPANVSHQLDIPLKALAENKNPVEAVKAVFKELKTELKTPPAVAEHIVKAVEKLEKHDFPGAVRETEKAGFEELKGLVPKTYHESLTHLANFAHQPGDHREAYEHLKNGEFRAARQAEPELAAAIAKHPMAPVVESVLTDVSNTKQAVNKGDWATAAKEGGRVVSGVAGVVVGLDPAKFLDNAGKAGDAFAAKDYARAGEHLDEMGWQLVDAALVLLLHEMSKSPPGAAVGEGAGRPRLGGGLEKPPAVDRPPLLEGKGIERQPTRVEKTPEPATRQPPDAVRALQDDAKVRSPAGDSSAPKLKGEGIERKPDATPKTERSPADGTAPPLLKGEGIRPKADDTNTAFAEVGKDVGTDLHGTTKYSSAADAAKGADEAGLTADKRPGFQSHSTKRSVQDALELPARTESAHVVPQAVYRALKEAGFKVSEGKALTVLVPKEVNAAIDAGWKAEWSAAQKAGTRVTVADLEPMISRSIEAAPRVLENNLLAKGYSRADATAYVNKYLNPDVQGSLQTRLHRELFQELNVPPDTVVLKAR
jgi:hypothetical protein